MKICHVITGSPTRSVGGQYYFALYDVCHRLSSSSVVVCNTPRRHNVTHPVAARDGGPVVLRPVRATPCLNKIESVGLKKLTASARSAN